MSRRGLHESPMDFEYQNGTGPMDARSPFAQLSQNAQNAQRFNSQQQQQQQKPSTAWPSTPRKGSTSPNKPLPAVPMFGNTAGAGGAGMGGRGSAFDKLYSTPRKFDTEMEDSSAGETPRSPDRMDVSGGGGSDAGTPEYAAKGGAEKFDFTKLGALQPYQPLGEVGSREEGKSRSPKREKKRPGMEEGDRRDSWLVGQLARMKHKLYSPGRGEVPRGDEGHRVMEKRIHKKRSRHLGREGGGRDGGYGVVSRRTRRRGSSISSTGTGDYHDNDTEDDYASRRKTSRKISRTKDPHPGSEIFNAANAGPNSAPHSQQQHPPTNEGNWLSRTFTFIASHPTVPHILSFYAQLAFNLFLLSGLAYLLYSFYAALQADIDNNSHAATAEILAEMAVCTEEFKRNRCDREGGGRVPAMERVCEEWGRCMSRDAKAVGRARVGAKTVAEVVNGFVEGISWKAMFFTSLLTFGSFAISNMAFGFFREKTQQAQHPPQYWQPPPPPTPQHPSQQYLFGAPQPSPQRQFSGEHYGWNGQQQQGLEPAPSGGAGEGWGQIEGRGSPVKKLGWS